ncbi:MAG TPA: prolipoprotein diacylglyceryl transferase [Rectinemataceae bacterium]|nr:prolipoprotein diacylglyceryl transferase [Rectinemataceae bacterium]
MPAAIQFPSWLSPEIIPGLPFRWYGLMYVVAFGISWLLFNYEAKRRQAPWSEDEAASFFFWAILGLLLGGRIFGTFLYDPTGYYLAKPWMAFWPFDDSGHFSGFQGMSYHGGLLGVVVATLLYTRAKRLSWLAFADVLAVSAPLGYTFGRLGNFINGELWGKVTASPIGMIFPNAERFSAKETWVQDIAAKVGIPISSMNDMVNLPRYPSQLFEATFEGLVLWFLLWVFIRKRKAFTGFASAAYVTGYGVARFVIEYFREPDKGVDWVIALGNPKAPTWTFTTPFNFSMGQVLSSFMIVAGILWMIYGGRLAAALEARSKTREDSQAASQIQEKTAAKNAARKRRKKLG